MNNLTVDIEIEPDVNLKFNFKKYIEHIISLSPDSDIIGLNKIIVRKNIPPIAKNIKGQIQAYYNDGFNQKKQIELFLINIIDVSIPYYAFNFYPEIGGLQLSKLIFHEIGHHVHFYKRHGVKKEKYEIFAEKYATAGYLKYFKSRSQKILSAYKWASFNFFFFNKIERIKIKEARQELLDYLSNCDTITFP